MKKNPNSGARLSSLIARLIPEIILRDIKNPHVGLVSVNEVRVNSDHSLAKVYVSFLGAKYPKQNFEELCSLKGLVRSRLSKKLGVYKAPDIVFVLDESFDVAESLEEALKKEESDLASLTEKHDKQD